MKVTTDTPGITPVSKPLQVAAKATGDEASDFPDHFLTPTSFTIAFNSFKLFKTDTTTTTGTTGSTASTYTVFDLGTTGGTAAGRPIIISLTTGQPQEVKENTSTPSQGTYDHVEYGIRYFEITIPLCDSNNACEDRRLRVYLTGDPDPDLNNFTPTPGAILISRSRNGTDFSWVSQAVGLPDSLTNFPVTGGAPTDPYLMPNSQFTELGAITSTFTRTISPALEIKGKPDKEFVFTLNFDLTDLFFFDNTDELNTGAIDPGPDFHFNALVPSTNIDTSRDGKILFGCTNPTPTICRADFWPGIPPAAVTVTEQERN
ncbi:MAG: hypothetical protein EPO39_18390 [Candidatus Manganitrophaceae bacterium]|nr:MAG: hypothetical protein EPO39_18390 [Candidatus Manganitrophaceae bacterium]